MIHYVTRVPESELFKNRQTGLTFWKVQGGCPIKMAHLQQSITECNIGVIVITPHMILIYTITCPHNNLSIVAIIEKYISNLDTFNISRHPLYSERINKKNYVKANSNNRSF